ncbi:MAG: filamentous hemagglutinin N-terminal domain-containing protein [Sphingomonadales bacterium]|nr:filamentous hemagglutinin N-terminal domain-containing protein [Sphingomonadales bacterium]
MISGAHASNLQPSVRRSRHGLNRVLLCATMLAGLAPATVHAQALPTGGTVVAGNAAIATNGPAMTVTQTGNRAIIDWAGFSVGNGASVAFQNGHGATLNRVTGTDISRIDGSLTATGSLYLVNANGVVIGKDGVVNTGGTFVASTLDIANADFIKGGDLAFSGASRAQVVNLGKVGSLGGNVALIGATVINQGAITAANGTAGLIAGGSVLLRDTANDAGGLFSVLYGDAQTSAANGGTIAAASAELRAQQGNVYALAGNTAGVIDATGVRAGQGKVWLVSEGGTTQVAGTITAQGPDGAAGFVETSGKTLQIGDTRVNSHDGNWLIDPEDLAIDAITAFSLQTSLITGDVTVTTNGAGSGGSGDILVNTALGWNSSHTLTLNAWRNIVFNANVDAGSSGKLALQYGMGAVAAGNTATYSLGDGAKIILPAGQNFTTQLGNDGTPVNWTVITDLGTATSHTGTDLQGMQSNLSGNYVLGADIDASATSGWNGGAGFSPIGDNSQFWARFNGAFDGLGHTISNLTVNRPGYNWQGLFGYVGSGTISNVALTNASVTGYYQVGGLVGQADGGSISNAFVSGSVSGQQMVGGIVGYTQGAIDASSSAASASGSASVGGLAGQVFGSTVSNSHASGTVSGGGNLGGLIGYVNSASLSNVFATGSVRGTSFVIGGLVGQNYGGTIAYAYATGSVTGGSDVGGLAGKNSGTIQNAFATGDVNGSTGGGLVAINQGTISDSYATGGVSGSGIRGGLVGWNDSGTISSSLALGQVAGSGNGLIGSNYNGTVTNSYWNTTTSGQSTSAGGSGATGLTTTQLAAALPTSFGATNWANGNNQTTPYLKGFGWAPTSGVAILGTDTSANATYYNVLTSIAQVQAINDVINFNPYGNYILGANIDATATAGWNGGAGFVPINDQYNWGFQGRFNGLGYTIDGLTINRPGQDYVGLFGIAQNSTITGVNLTNAAITGRGNVGGIVGISYGTVSNSSVSGSVFGSYHVGGLVGDNEGTISGSHASATIDFDSNGSRTQIGGLVGYNGHIITTSYATGTVNSSGQEDGQYLGGLVGMNANGTISRSYASGNVLGYAQVGGLVGANYYSGAISDSYATGSATGSQQVGGLVGDNYASSTIDQSYATGHIVADFFLPQYQFGGGLVGRNDNAASVTNSYWNTDTSGQSTSAGGTGLTTTQLMQASNFSNWSIDGVGGQNATWRIYEGSTAPLLKTFLTQATVNVAAQTTATYNGLVPSADFTATLADGSAADRTKILGTANSVCFAGGCTDVGTYTLSFTTNGLYSTQQGYDIVGGHAGSSNLTINPRAISVTADALSRVYGDANPALTFTVGGAGLAGGDTIASVFGGALATSATSISDVNAYAITQGTLALGSSNYTLTTFTDGTLTVTQRPLTVTANAATRLYGDFNPTFTYTVSGGFVGSDTAASILRGSLAAEANARDDVNTYPILRGSLASNSGNYSIVYQGADLTVTPRPVTVTYTADAVSRIYGNDNPTLSGIASAGGYTSTSGFIGGDHPTGTALWTTTADATSHVGSYGITGSGLTVGSNYTLTEVQAAGNATALTVTARPITVTADNVSRSYGDDNTINGGSLFTYSITSQNGLVGSDSFAGSLTSTADQTTGIGNYAVTQGDLALSTDYALTVQPGTLTINPRYLQILYWATGQSRAYGDANPVLTGSVTPDGLVNNDQLSGTAVWTTAANATSNVGNYAITGSGLTASANYDVHVAQNPFRNFTITQRYVNVTADAVSRAYGDANPALTYTVSRASGTGSGLVNGDTLSTGALATTASPGSSVGTYAITQGTLNNRGVVNSNYSIRSFTGANLTINPRALTVTYTAAASSRTYGDNPDGSPALTGSYTTSGLYGTDTVSGTATWSSTATATTGAGGQAITGAGITASANYTVTAVQAAGNATALTINPKALTITYTATAASRIYGDANPAFTGTATSSGLVNGDTLSGTALWATTATVATGVSTADITGSGLTAGANYTVTAVQAAGNSAALTITQRPLNITYTATAAARAYGDANPSLTGTVTADNLVNGDTLGATALWATAVGTTTGVGSYGVTGSGAVASANYVVTSAQSPANATALTINPRALTVTYTATAASRAYGDANPSLTGEYASIGLVNGDTLSGTALWSTTATAATGIGHYGITGSGLTASSNYTLTTQQAEASASALTINPRALAVTYTADAASRAYGDSNPTLTGTASASGLVNGDTLSGTAQWATTADNTTGIGNYGITGTGLTASANYTLTVAQGANNDTALTINPRALTITYTASPFTRVYGAGNAGMTGVAIPTGLVNDDTLTGTVRWTSPWGATAPVGSYNIVGSGLAANANYTVTSVQAAANATALTINPRPLTVTYTATAATRIYGDANPALSGTVTWNGLVNGDQLSGSALWATTATTATGVGNYAVTGSGLTASGNYTLTVAQAAGNAGALAINPRALTITYTATAASRVSGLANPAFTGTTAATGLAGTDTLAGVTSGTATWTSAADAASLPGNYAINGAGLAGNSGNYSFAFQQAAANATALTVQPVIVNLPVQPVSGGVTTDPGVYPSGPIITLDPPPAGDLINDGFIAPTPGAGGRQRLLDLGDAQRQTDSIGTIVIVLPADNGPVITSFNNNDTIY